MYSSVVIGSRLEGASDGMPWLRLANWGDLVPPEMEHVLTLDITHDDGHAGDVSRYSDTKQDIQPLVSIVYIG